MDRQETVVVLVVVALVLNTTFAAQHETLLDVCIGEDDKQFDVITKPNVTGPCEEWHDRSCCSGETVPKVETNFNYDHCDKKMSNECKRYFYMRSCFGQCSPNLGPWLKEENETLRRSTAKYVPMCREECKNWWEACKDEHTCAENWSTGFEWENGTNRCRNGTECKTFQSLYEDSTYFCEHVYGPFDFLVVNDDTHCMMIFERISDNSFVADHYAREVTERSKNGTRRLSFNFTKSKKEYCAHTLCDNHASTLPAKNLVMCFFLGVLLGVIGLSTGYCFVTKCRTKKNPYAAHVDENYRPVLSH